MLQFLKQKQHNSAMESGDHSKNGVSPKNQRSRGNFLASVCFALLAVSIIFCGCSKDKDDNNGNGNGEEKVQLLKTMTIGGDYIIEYVYDEDDRITAILEYSNGVLQNTETFTYSGNDLIKVDIHGDDLSFNFSRNGNLITNNEMNGGNPRVTTIELNSDGYPIKSEGDGYFGGTTIYQYQDGNLVKVSQSDSYSSFDAQFKYDDKKSPFYHCKTPKWFMIMYYYKNCFGIKNNMTEVFVKYSDHENSTKLEYEYDDNGFPTKILDYGEFELTFTYQ